MSSEAKIASREDIEGLLGSIPLVQYVAAGSCGVKYVSKGLEIVEELHGEGPGLRAMQVLGETQPPRRWAFNAIVAVFI